jgi:sensor histidine kinase YesM
VGVNIQNKIAQFNVISDLALLSIGAIGTLYIISADQLYNPYSSFFNTMEILLGFLVLLAIGLPALNIIRKIELSIHKNTQHKYFKVLLLFLSTSLIPTVSLLLFAFFIANQGLDNAEIQFIIYFFCVFTFIGAIRALISFYILKEKEIKIETEVKFAKLNELKTKAELGALHSKINPHFLYNSLNSIAGLAKTDSEKTEHMALSLSKLFRYSINKEQSDWSTLEEEIQMVNIYLDIEKVRFDDRLKFTIDLPDELKTAKIPRFSIQPLVENAVKHGISKLVAKGEIHISARKTEKWLEIAVCDNGNEFPKELEPGFGIQSIYDKLEIMYPNGFELHFVNAPNKHILLKLS